MKVEIASKKMVKPSRSTVDRLKSLKISCIDQLLYHGYVPVLFFFKATGQGRQQVLSEGVCKLEESLSEALTLFYPLAGRTAKSEEKLRALVTLQNVAENDPLVAIRVNVFECGGFAIALRFSHMVADLCSMNMFLRSWAAWSIMENRDVTVHAHPDFASSARFPATRLSVEGRIPQEVGEEKFVRDWFSFPPECLRNEFGVSRVVMVSAIISRALLNSVDRARRFGSQSRSFTIFHAMNLRGSTGPPVAQDYFGNMFALAVIKSILVDEKDSKLEGMAKLIGGGLSGARERYSAAASDGELFSMIAESMRQFAGLLSDKGEYLMVFSSWCGFGLPDIDFGWGPPEITWMSSGLDVRSTILVDRSDGGIDALVGLSENDMILFKQDPDITCLSDF